MKNNILILVSLIFCTIIQAQIKGNGQIISKTFDLREFLTIEVNFPIEAEIDVSGT